HRRAGEIQFAFRVAVDVPAETVVGQPVQRAVVDDRGGGELLELGVAETEVEYGVQCARDATDDAVPPAVRQPTCEQFEHAVPLGGPAGQCTGEHGELVVIGQQCSTGVHGCVRRVGHPSTLWVGHRTDLPRVPESGA